MIGVIGPLDLAVKEKIISSNPWNPKLVDLSGLVKSERRKPSKLMIFFPDEIKIISDALLEAYQYNHNTCNLALLINFELGLRIGELAALKWTDINWKHKTLSIQRMQDSSGEVVDAVKSDSTAGYRELMLSNSAISLLSRLKSDEKVINEYIFVNDQGKRRTTVQLEDRLVHCQERIGFDYIRKSHCIRRTVGTRIANILGLETARQWLGHTDIRTTLKYIYSDLESDKMREFIEKSSVIPQIITDNHQAAEITSITDIRKAQ